MPAESQFSYKTFEDWSGEIVKQNDESLVSSITLQDDNEFQFPVILNASYFFELILAYTGNGVNDIKHAFALAAGTFLRGWRSHNGLGPSTAIAQTGIVADMTTVINNATVNEAAIVHVIGHFVTDTSTTIKLQWAQQTSDAGATIVKAGSILHYRRVV